MIPMKHECFYLYGVPVLHPVNSQGNVGDKGMPDRAFGSVAGRDDIVLLASL